MIIFCSPLSFSSTHPTARALEQPSANAAPARYAPHRHFISPGGAHRLPATPRASRRAALTYRVSSPRCCSVPSSTMVGPCQSHLGDQLRNSAAVSDQFRCGEPTRRRISRFIFKLGSRSLSGQNRLIWARDIWLEAAERLLSGGGSAPAARTTA